MAGLMYLRARDLMYLLALPSALLTLVGLGVPTTWWWVLALPYLVPGVLSLVVEVVDAALARMEQQGTEGPHP